MSLASILHPNRRRQPRHSGREERPLAALPVPAAQAEAASGPQPALRDFPDGAQPAEDVVQEWPRGQHPYAPEPQPSFTPHPAANWHSGARITQAYAPDFAESTRRARPYAAPGHAASHLLPALDAGTQMLPPSIGDDLAKRWQPAEAEPQAWKARQQTGSINYPKCGLRASFGDYAAFFRQVDEITGTHGTDRWPLAALPAADERWGALTDSLEDAAQALGETTGLGAAHVRLREAVEAAPDVETALRLARNAAEAGITGQPRFVPVQAEEAA